MKYFFCAKNILGFFLGTIHPSPILYKRSIPPLKPQKGAYYSSSSLKISPLTQFLLSTTKLDLELLSQRRQPNRPRASTALTSTLLSSLFPITIATQNHRHYDPSRHHYTQSILCARFLKGT